MGRRGIAEVGIYRVNGSAVDMGRLKRAYESNPYEAEQLLKECDIHAVAGILKQYLRDLPQCIFTSEAYPKLFEAYAIQDEAQRSRTYLHLFSQLPQNPSQACIVFLIEHLVRVAWTGRTRCRCTTSPPSSAPPCSTPGLAAATLPSCWPTQPA